MPTEVRFRVVRAARTRCPAGWQWRHRAGRERAINWWLVEAGRCRLQSHGAERLLHAGDCLWQDLQTSITALNEGPESYVVSWCDVVVVDQLGRPLPHEEVERQLPRIFRHCRRSAFLGGLMRRIITAHAVDAARSDRWFAVLLDELHAIDALVGPGEVAARHEEIHDLCRLIEDDPGASWTVEAMARRLGLSRDHFSRLFKTVVGEPPSDLVMRRRLEAACALLERGESGLAAIAEELGFCDIYHFSRRFKIGTGLSPSEYRRHFGS